MPDIASWICMCNKDVYEQLAWISKDIHSRFLYLWYSAHLSTFQSTLQLFLCCHLFDYSCCTCGCCWTRSIPVKAINTAHYFSFKIFLKKYLKNFKKRLKKEAVVDYQKNDQTWVWALTVIIHNCYDKPNKSGNRIHAVLSLQLELCSKK